MLSFLIGIICILLHRPKKLTLVLQKMFFFFMKNVLQKCIASTNHWNITVIAIASLLSISKFKVDSSLKRPYLAGQMDKASSQTNKEIDAGFGPNLKGIL